MVEEKTVTDVKELKRVVSEYGDDIDLDQDHVVFWLSWAVNTIKQLEADKAELVEVLDKSLRSFKITQRPEMYREDVWCNRAIKLIAKHGGHDE